MLFSLERKGNEEGEDPPPYPSEKE